MNSFPIVLCQTCDCSKLHFEISPIGVGNPLMYKQGIIEIIDQNLDIIYIDTDIFSSIFFSKGASGHSDTKEIVFSNLDDVEVGDYIYTYTKWGDPVVIYEVESIDTSTNTVTTTSKLLYTYNTSGGDSVYIIKSYYDVEIADTTLTEESFPSGLYTVTINYDYYDVDTVSIVDVDTYSITCTIDCCIEHSLIEAVNSYEKALHGECEFDQNILKDIIGHMTIYALKKSMDYAAICGNTNRYNALLEKLEEICSLIDCKTC